MAELRGALKGQFTEEEIRAALDIGEMSDIELDNKLQELFETLGDPLLSADDIATLLKGGVTAAQVSGALARGLERGLFESDDKTQRPLDPEGIVLYRLADVEFGTLRLLAVESLLSEDDRVYQFSIDGRLVRSTARVDRLDAISGQGNQRTEIRNHVLNIAKGIEEGEDVPSALLLVINEGNLYRAEEADDGDEPKASDVVVTPLGDFSETAPEGFPSTEPSQISRLVEISIPYRPAAFDEEKPLLIVDGQQRTAAVSLVSRDVRPQIMLSVNALVANADQAKKIFAIANSTQKIATDFSRALNASMDEVPPHLRKDRIPALVTQSLSLKDVNSPFFEQVRYPGAPPTKSKPIAFNTLFQAAITFASSSLYEEDTAPATVAEHMKRAFNIVKSIWASAWGENPKVSKLMHGAGIRALAAVIVEELEIYGRQGYKVDSDEAWNKLESTLKLIAPAIAWTEKDAIEGNQTQYDTWEKQLKKRQNTNQDITDLTKFLKRVIKKVTQTSSNE